MSMADKDLLEKRRIEIENWAISPLENPSADFLRNLIAKIAEFGPAFLEALYDHHEKFARASRILELGGGQGWACCVLKNYFPHASVTASDISPHAIASLGRWERAFGVQVDASAVCTSDDIPFPDRSFDLIFAFASAHHFRTHRRTFREIARVLREGGKCLYLFEPSCSPAMYRLALWRAERKRPSVPEDVLRYSELRELASEAGLQCEITLRATARNRQPIEAMYYRIFGLVPQLLWFLPCTMDYIFTKEPAE